MVARPAVSPGSSPTVRFEVEDLNLYSRQGERLTSGIVWNSFKECVHSILGRYQVDFGPSLNELKTLLRSILPRHTAAQMKQVVDSLHLSGVRAGPDGLTAQIGLEVEAVPPTDSVAEPSLTPEEMKHWEKQWESWDAVMT